MARGEELRRLLLEVAEVAEGDPGLLRSVLESLGPEKYLVLYALSKLGREVVLE